MKKQMHLDEYAILRGALDTFGAESQTLVMMEEMSELQKELCKYARGAENMSWIAEEIADVQIMLEQMIILHGCAQLVREYRESKLERLRERLGETP